MLFHPSSANRAIKCVGSLVIEGVPLPDNDSNQPALEGTATHWFAERVLSGDDPDSMTDRAAPNGIIIDESIYDCAMVYVEYIRSIDGDWNIEKPIYSDIIHDGHGGTPDAWLYDGGLLHIVDFKTGFTPVPAEGNAQLADYAIMLMEENKLYGVDLMLTIVQPKLYPQVKNWMISGTDLWNEFLPKLQAPSRLIAEGNAQLNSGPHCYQCPKAHFCPALANSMFTSLDYVHNPVPRELTHEEIAHELDMLSSAESHIKHRKTAIEELALHKIKQSPGSVPGYTIETVRGRETFKNKNVYKAIESLTGLKVHKEVGFTPNQMRKAGVDESIINPLTVRSVKKKLTKINMKKIKEMFHG